MAMLRPLRPVTRRQVAQSKSVPPPVGGWNRRDALDLMKPQDAVVLDNWFPRESDVITRKGYTSHCDTTEAMPVDYLFEHYSGSTRKLLAFCNGKLLDVTSTSPATISSGGYSGGWVGAMFNGRSFFGNGTNSSLDYDGTTLTATAWTGVTTSELDFPFVFKNRLWWIQTGTQKGWYGGVNSVTGALTSFDFAGVGQHGGNLVAFGALTHDAGDGVDDYFCAFMSSGDVFVYQGTGDPASFALVGIYHLGPLVNKRAVGRVGSDLLAITSDGYVPVSKAILAARARPTIAISDKISETARLSVKTYAANSGWQAQVYPGGSYLLVNVPVASTTIQQHVMNLSTGAWCRFTGQNALCWSLYADNLYFGNASGVVYKADNGYSDGGSAIQTDGQIAWNYFGSRGSQKKFNAIRPIFVCDGDPGAQYGTGVDFDSIIPTAALAVPSSSSSYVWDDPTSIWDVATWAGAQRPARGWQTTAGGIGYCASMRVRTANDAKQVRWQATNFIYEQGGLM